MARKVMINVLELQYAPICSNDFYTIKDDEVFRRQVQQSTIYVLTQRRELTFEEFTPEIKPSGEMNLHFQIRQKGNSSVLKCIVPVDQPNLVIDQAKGISFRWEYASPVQAPLRTFPQPAIRNLLIDYADGGFLAWLSPENFIQGFLNGVLHAAVEGPIEEFLKYKVLYVGKATDQDVWKRLTSHATLQEILGTEYPLHLGSLPAHEIGILFFKLKDAIGLHTISANDPVTSDIINSLNGDLLAPERAACLDAEKALINAMRPKYNKQFYKNYPQSTDGLSPHGLDGYCFQIHSHIILQYENGEIRGWPGFNADALVVTPGETLKVVNKR